MGDLSEHFSRWEFDCKCGCGQDTVDAELLIILEAISERFKQVVHINSGNRCLTYNRLKDSEDTSQHVISKAADIRVENVPAEIVFNFLVTKFPDKYGFGYYDFFVHVDCRANRERW